MRGCGRQNPSPFGVGTQSLNRVTVEASRCTVEPFVPLQCKTALRKPGRKTAALLFLAPMRWPIRRPLSSFGAPFVYRTEPRVRRFASRCQRRFYFRGQWTVRVLGGGGGFGAQTRWRRRDRYSGALLLGAVPPGARLRCGERNIRTLRSTKD